MAKTKALGSSNRKRSRSGSKTKPRPKTKVRDAASTKSADAVRASVGKHTDAAVPPPGQRPLSNHHIGEVAGEIWQVLAEQNGQSLAALKKSIDAPTDLVIAALGWLAREGKLEFSASGRTAKVSLRE